MIAIRSKSTSDIINLLPHCRLLRVFSHHVILEHVLSDALEVTELAGDGQRQLPTLDVLTMFRGAVLHKIEFLRADAQVAKH